MVSFFLFFKYSPLPPFFLRFAMTFTGTPLTAYAVGKLNVSPAQLNITGTMLALPWSFKVLYGLLSDCVPIRGKRRKPYFIIGWSIFIGRDVKGKGKRAGRRGGG
jgi:hypothetical protein